jgi:hypothetical protein
MLILPSKARGIPRVSTTAGSLTASCGFAANYLAFVTRACIRLGLRACESTA